MNNSKKAKSRKQGAESNSEFSIQNAELVSFVPAKEFPPHVQHILRGCWHEVFSWQKKIMGAELELYIIGDEEMREINNKYRQIDKVTDVISLDFGEDDLQGKLGVIYLNRHLITKMAKHFGHSEDAEIIFLSVHGMLHVWGYDHEKKSDEEVMVSAMKRILENVPQYAPLVATYKRRSVIDY